MRVLVTRPGDVAARTAERVAAMGHEPVLLPLFECRLDPAADAAAAGPRAGIIFTSANGVAAVSAPADPDELVYAVGSATGEAARLAGWRNLRTGTGWAVDLAAMIAADSESGRLSTTPERPLVYVAGETRKPYLEAGLATAGIAFRTVVGYRMDEIRYSTDFFSKPEMAEPVEAILLYSAEAARRMATLARRKDVAVIVDGAIAVCLSRDVADALGPDWADRHKVATQPAENALLASLAALR